MTTKTIVFIHGNFVSYESWNPWVKRFEAKGYKCVAIPYPLRDKPVETLKKIHPDPKLAELGIDEVIEHHVRTIKALDEPPIIIGHSYGGMLTQLMVNRGLAAAAVAIDSVPPQGVLSFKWSFIKSTMPLFSPLSSSPWLMPFKHFQYAFTNGMSLEDQRNAYEAYVVPESLQVCRGGVSRKAHVDFKKPHAPLLLIGGEIDNIMPASLNRANYKRYKASLPSVTEYKEFAGHNHFSVVGGKGWEEIADYALDWAVNHLGSTNTQREPLRMASAR